jgi:hypothetical protein
MGQPLNSSGDEDEALQREHLSLLRQLEALELEHRQLETGPFDRAAHAEHLRHLAQAKEDLRAHMARLKRRRPSAAS